LVKSLKFCQARYLVDVAAFNLPIKLELTGPQITESLTKKGEGGRGAREKSLAVLFSKTHYSYKSRKVGAYKISGIIPQYL